MTSTTPASCSHAGTRAATKSMTWRLWGPTLTETLMDRILNEKTGAFAHDWIARVNSPGSHVLHVRRGGTLPRRPPTVNAKDIGPAEVYKGTDWEVTTALAEHAQPWLDSLAYRVDSSQGSVVVIGDTRPCKTVADLAKGADVMLCCCWGRPGADGGARRARHVRYGGGRSDGPGGGSKKSWSWYT